jgi:hypothetical protein
MDDWMPPARIVSAPSVRVPVPSKPTKEPTEIAWIQHGDCVELMRRLPSDSVDSVVCDPPYSLGFMGKTWDDQGTAEQIEESHRAWTCEALRVLKPGGHLLAFGGTRTYHRLACALEDAGFEIRDCLMWLYGQGFPKSLDVSKAIDKALDDRRACTRAEVRRAAVLAIEAIGDETAPKTPAAKQWDGWGTALKPAWEPIILARKPLIGTVAENVLTHGTGALNIDGNRIVGGDPANLKRLGRSYGDAESKTFRQLHAIVGGSNLGRWPANLLLTHAEGCELVGTKRIETSQGVRGGRKSTEMYRLQHETGQKVGYGVDGKETVEDWRCVEDCPVRLLDEQSGESNSNKRPATGRDDRGVPGFGGASRFFYCGKAPSNERWALCKTCDAVLSPSDRKAHEEKTKAADPKHEIVTHPTQKPVALMRYLIRLVTPPNGTILNPFLGSGSAAVAAKLEGMNMYAFDTDADYVRFARARVAATESEA